MENNISNRDAASAGAAAAVADPEAAYSYCCECGTYDAHTIRCLRCGFDFRAEPEICETAD